MATSTFMTRGWSAQSLTSSVWGSGILLDVPAVINQYPPGIDHKAWRTSTAPISSQEAAVAGRQRSRPSLARSNRRAAPPPPSPTQSRYQPIAAAFPSEDSYHSHHENTPNTIFHTSSPRSSRPRIATQAPSPTAYSYQTQHMLAEQQRAVALREARLKTIANIMLNRVNVVGKPMRRRNMSCAEEGQRAYIRSGLGRCISVAE